MRYNNSMAILAVVDDLVFRAKIEAAAKPREMTVRIATDIASVRQALAETSYDRVIVDLNLAAESALDVVTAIRQTVPSVPILGYCSHIHTDLQGRARQAGCSEILSRASLVQRLPELVASGR